ncbi:hypothetical protein Ancab_020438 [Ancistrocladus abbreviatus]
MANDAPEKSESFASHNNDDQNNNNKDKDKNRQDIDNVDETKRDSGNADQKTEGTQEDAGNVEGEKKADDGGNNVDQEEPKAEADICLDNLFEEMDQFISTISNVEDKSQLVVISNVVEKLLKKVEKMIEASEPCESKFTNDPEDHSSFATVVNLLLKLMEMLGGFTSESNTTLLLNETSSVLHQTMLFLEDELRCLLEEPKDASLNSDPSCKISSSTPDSSRGLKTKSFKHLDQEADRCSLPDQSGSTEEESFPSHAAEAIYNMNLISKLMVSAGYQSECCYLFFISRLHAFEEELNRQGFDNVSIDDVQKMQWETLEGEIGSWIGVLKHCSSHLLVGEQKFCSSVFSYHPSLSKSLFSHIARAVLIQLVNFAEAVVMTKRSTEKLFKFLDMYKTLRDLASTVDESLYTEECVEELKSELHLVSSWLGEAIVCIFCELENSIKHENAKTPAPNGAVHSVAHYTMNYLKDACEYKDTLEQVFRQHKKADRSQEYSEAVTEEEKQTDENHKEEEKQSPFTVQLLTILDMLDASLETISNHYKDPSLRYVFLMNNGRYMLKNVRGSTKIQQVVGDPWCRKRSAEMMHYHKSYQRETWSKVLQCLNQEGLQVNGKVYKPNLKERFKNFNQLFEEIYKTQSTWVMSDEQLQSELRVSISAVMIPAYRSFVGRFGQYFTPGRQTEKYIRYQPEDIESALDELFDGKEESTSFWNGGRGCLFVVFETKYFAGFCFTLYPVLGLMQDEKPNSSDFECNQFPRFLLPKFVC